jgi:hypothetical protein
MKPPTLPMIDKKFIGIVMKILCIKTDKRGRPAKLAAGEAGSPNQETKDINKKLTSFYNEHYLPLTQYPIIYIYFVT